MFALRTSSPDPEKRLLVFGPRTVALRRESYLVLQYLIQNRNRMILRKELLDRFWGGKQDRDSALSNAIASIRKAYGEDRGGSAFIETHQGLGYRYVGPCCEAISAAPALPYKQVPDSSDIHFVPSLFSDTPDAALATIPPSVSPLRHFAKVATKQWFNVLLFASLVVVVAVSVIGLSSTLPERRARAIRRRLRPFIQ